MNIWRIAFKEVKALRDVKQVIFLIVTPVLLTLILGTVLTNVFNSSVNIGDIRVLYKNHSIEENRIGYWDLFVEQASDSGISFEQVSGDTNGKLEVENNRYVGYVEISDSGMEYYGNSRSRIESDIAEGHLTSYANRYKLVVEVMKEHPEQASTLWSVGGQTDYVEEILLEGARKPSAFDYYAVAMITLIIMYSAMSASQSIDLERKRNTAARLLASPVSKLEIFAGKIAGNLLQNGIAVVIVVLICKYMLNVYWGENLWLVFLVLFTQIVFALSLGLGFSYLVKGNASMAIVMTIIQIAAFFGGSYFPLESVTGILRTIASYSPLEWTTEALLQIIFADNGFAAVRAILLNLGFSVLFLSAAVMIMRRREGM